jgi:hypothetical protein
MSCGICEHFNLHYHPDEHERTRGQWGKCVFPHRMNLDNIYELDELIKEGIVKDVKVWRVDSCKHFMEQHAYGGQ